MVRSGEDGETKITKIMNATNRGDGGLGHEAEEAEVDKRKQHGVAAVHARAAGVRRHRCVLLCRQGLLASEVKFD